MRPLGSPREENGPDGYPKPGMNPAWEEARDREIEAARPKAEKWRAFQKLLEQKLREKARHQT